MAAHARDVNILIWTAVSRSVIKQMIASWSVAREPWAGGCCLPATRRRGPSQRNPRDPVDEKRPRRGRQWLARRVRQASGSSLAREPGAGRQHVSLRSPGSVLWRGKGGGFLCILVIHLPVTVRIATRGRSVLEVQQRGAPRVGRRRRAVLRRPRPAPAGRRPGSSLARGPRPAS